MANRPAKRPTSQQLLQEYESCHRTVTLMETTIWQTGAAMSLGLAGAFVLVAVRGLDAQPPWWVAVIVGILSFAVSAIWWFVARRWWSIQHAMFLRMRHIERALGMHSFWYIQSLDHPELLKKVRLPKEDEAELLARSARKNTVGIHDHQRTGPQALLWVLPFVLLAIWWLYALVLLVSTVLGAA